MFWTKFSGHYLMVTGIIHNALGIILGWDIIAGIINDGWWNTIETEHQVLFDRSAITWFLLVGCFWILFGFLLNSWHKYTQQPIPAYLGYGFILLGALIASLLPKSGAWLFIIQGGLIVLDANRNRRST